MTDTPDEETARQAGVTQTSHPTIFEALETVSHDSGGRAGHASYVVPGDWPDLDQIEADLKSLTPDELSDFCIGDYDENTPTRGKFPRAEQLLNTFFEEGGCPVCDADRLP